MARISDLTYQKLARCTNWYLRPATVRDATYVLDEILDNETELPLLEHTTDTAGYTEIVFALFDLLGLQFSPRIRDLGDQRLFRLDRQKRHPHLGPLLKGRINRDRILRHWDELLRVAGSLKRGWVTASLLIGKLQSYPRKNRLTRTLQEYGRLIKTIFILRYLESEQLRRRIAAAIPYPCSDHRQDFFGGRFRRTSLLLESMRRFEGGGHGSIFIRRPPRPIRTCAAARLVCTVKSKASMPARHPERSWKFQRPRPGIILELPVRLPDQMAPGQPLVTVREWTAGELIHVVPAR